ncbi:hypothetical protein ACSNN9_25250 [Micromonospora sp. URMC 107]|uniref:hypothetical protein n=1 Tax=Micromonospora sp. URMC 107 TaxID=3423418 RepID=UPI003F19D3BA
MSNPIRLYVAAPALSAAALAAATAALLAAGFLVTSATIADTVDPDDLLAVVADDLAAARAADAVVALPGAEDFPEPVYAALHGVPALTLADALASAQ